MNLSAAVIALSAAVSPAAVSAHSYSHSISAKGSKASSKAAKSKATKSKATKSKAAKAGSYSFSMSMSLPHCKKSEQLDFDTGMESIEVDVNKLVTPEAGKTFNYFSYTPATDQYECEEGDEIGIMLFSADNENAPDGTLAECDYEACYEEDCAPDCCCANTILIMVDD